jgi:hypothetical protein
MFNDNTSSNSLFKSTKPERIVLWNIFFLRKLLFHNYTLVRKQGWLDSHNLSELGTPKHFLSLLSSVDGAINQGLMVMVLSALVCSRVF